MHFSSILSGHLALVARNDPLVNAANFSDSSSTSGGPPASPIIVQFEQTRAKAGLLVTEELRAGVARVTRNVAAISKACRARNSKFRDVEFDLEEDREKCLHGLDTKPSDRSDPSDVQRVTQTFRTPQFFVDGASSTDVVQGALGDCWFLSGAAAVATKPELVENFCVARDEQVGVYGFMFQRNGIWVDVIIDDLLYTAMPKYEELTSKEQQLYHEDKDRYNGTARLGSKTLYFAKSGSTDETWVPLLEKAYAKLHGDYASLTSGHVGEAMEDLTGGVSTVVHVNDILDSDRFWRDELLRANDDRLFGCSIYDLRHGSGQYPGDPGYGPPTKTVNGLYTAHAYSIIKAVEYNGKRFLRIRNPWGNSEWTGRWSDGSKEWTPQWVAALESLGHSFGDDGAFIMEYQDFLDTWTLVHRTRLFDPSWVVSSLWMNAKVRLPGMVWDYGDISFTFTLPVASPVIIVLSKLDDRYARGLLDRMRCSLEFQVYKRGGTEPVVASGHSIFHLRSVNAEADLEAGEYVVHVRVDSEIVRDKDYLINNIPKWNTRKIAQVLSLASVSSSILANFPAETHDNWLPRPPAMWAGRDLQEIQSAVDAMNALNNAQTPLPYPSTATPSDSNPYMPGPHPVSMVAAPVESESGYDDSDGDGSGSDVTEEDNNAMYEIPGFPLSPPSAGHNQNKEYPGSVDPVRVRSPPIIPGTPQLDIGMGLTVDVQAAVSGSTSRQRSGARHVKHRSRNTNDTPIQQPISFPGPPRREVPSRQTTNQSEISTVSTTLLGRPTDLATAKLLANPDVQMNDDPELGIGLRVFTKDYGTVEIKGQMRQGKLYPWRM